MQEHALVALAGIVVIALICQWVAWIVKLPAILFLLLAGIVVGPVIGWLNPNAMFGDLLFPAVSLSVAIILFEGALTLKFHEIKGLERVVRRMVSTGMLATWLIIGIATHWLLGFDWDIAMLFGALVVVTGPTVITPMLRTVRPKARIAQILRWEGIMIDPLGALLAVLVFEFIISGASDGAAISHTFLSFFKLAVIGLSLGALAGYLWGLVLRFHMLPEYLHNIGTLAVVFGIFALSDSLQEESGLLTVTVMGIWLANMRDVDVSNILDFKESLSVLLISGLFIILAARIEFSQIAELGWAALGIFLVIQFVARPIKILISTAGSTITWQEKALLSWIAPRGIVAAAVSALFALKLEAQGYEQAHLLVPLTFIMIIGTVVLQSATARPLAKYLNVCDPEPRGFLIVGANQVARKIGKALKESDFQVLLADSSWDNIRQARMDGLPTYFGNVVSEHADRHLDLVGVGKLLGLSHFSERNALASLRYRSEFGVNNIYTLQSSQEKDRAEKHQVALQRRGKTLFGKEITYSKLASLLSQNAEIKATRLSTTFSYETYLQQLSGIPMFAIDPKERIYVFVAEQELKPTSDWTILALVQKPPASPPPRELDDN